MKAAVNYTRRHITLKTAVSLVPSGSHATCELGSPAPLEVILIKRTDTYIPLSVPLKRTETTR